MNSSTWQNPGPLGSAACQSKNFLLLRYLKSLSYNSAAELWQYTHIAKLLDSIRVKQLCPTLIPYIDKMSKEQRSRCMASIHSKDTKPEILVRRYLFDHGFRYRLNHPRLLGHPDIVMRKYRTVIFVNGCFWHGHEGCKYFVLLKSRADFVG